MNLKKTFSLFFTLILVILLTACPSGGNSENTPLVLSVDSGGVKTLTFSWDAYMGAAYYKLLVNPDGASGYIQEGSDIASTSVKIVVPVHLTDWINASYMLEAYDDGDNLLASSGATTVTSLMLSSIGYFKASNTGEGDWFGYSVALSGDGNTLAVGAYAEDSASTGINSTPNVDGTAGGSGAAYLFRLVDGTWSQEAYIKASNTGAYDWFGFSVALSGDGNTLTVGAQYESSNTTGINSTPNDDGFADSSGAVYVFRYVGGNWVEEAYIKASNSGAVDVFGSSVALSGDGNTLAVGAGGEDSSTTGINSTPNDDGSANSSGAVYLFRYAAGNWSQDAYIKASNTGASDWFGSSLALSGDGATLAVGALYEDSASAGINSTPNDDGTAESSGAVYLFRYAGGNWAEEAYIKASNSGADDWFGFSVALSGDGATLAVGALHEDSASTGINSTPNDDGTADSSGAVYLFRYAAGNWSHEAYIKASITGWIDGFGYSVALSVDGNTMAVGAPGVSGTTDDRGPAYLFRYASGNWSQVAYIKALNTDVGDNLGSSLALSGDGNTLVVGAPGEDSGTTGINTVPDEGATKSGAVYLY